MTTDDKNPTPRKRDHKAEYAARQARAGGQYRKQRRAAEAARPTPATYNAFQAAFSTLNRELFGGKLPHVLITLRTVGKARGYYSRGRFIDITTATQTDEIAMDPRQFIDRSAVEILSTLAHEMVHLWQFTYGTPSRPGYHNTEWADQMESIGLMPSNTGEPGGKRTGQQMTHYIIPGGRFEASAQRLVESGKFRATWADIDGILMVGGQPVPGTAVGGVTAPPKRTNTRTKFACPHCGDAAWGKADLVLMCANAQHSPAQMQPVG